MIEDVSSKTIAVVGSANYMSKFDFGHEIDSHDIVVRINKGIDIISKESYEKFGSKSDILYHHLLEDPRSSNGPKFGFIEPEKWKKAGVKTVFCLPNSSYEGIATGNYLTDLVNIENVKKLQSVIPLKMVDFNFYNFISRNTKCKPNTGIIAICHLLSMNPKKLSLFGFSFLLDGWIKEYREGIEQLEENLVNKLTIDQIADKALHSKRHKQENQWEFIKSLYSQNRDLIFPDAHMKKILEMKNFNQKEYFSL